MHVLWNVFTGLSLTLLGDIVQKWFESVHTGLPVAVLSAMVRPLRFSWEPCQSVAISLVPWAVRGAIGTEELLEIRYEHLLYDPVADLRQFWRIFPPNIWI